MSKNTVFKSLERKKQYKYPYILLSLYLTSLLSTVVLANKLIQIGNIHLPGGIFIFTFTFAICDIAGEVYGYAYPRFYIWLGLMAEFVFSINTILASHTPSPDYFGDANAYKLVFDPTLRYVVSGLIGLFIGEFINIYSLAKCKILLHGKFYLLRSFISTAFGQAVLTIIVDLLNYTGKMPSTDLLSMMVYGYSWKLLFVLITLFPSWVVVRYLKRAEGIDHYDINTNFNPFILGIETRTCA